MEEPPRAETLTGRLKRLVVWRGPSDWVGSADAQCGLEM